MIARKPMRLGLQRHLSPRSNSIAPTWQTSHEYIGPIQNSFGDPPGLCTGTFLTLFNDGGNFDPGPGNSVWVQAWYRDPADPFGFVLSNGIQIDVQ